MTIVVDTDVSSAWGVPHDQGSRPTCLAFALSDVNQHLNGTAKVLSAEYLYRSVARQTPGWKAGDGLQLAAALTTVGRTGQPSAAACPYAPFEPVEVPPGLPLLPASPPDAARLYGSTLTAADLDAHAVVAHLLEGKPVGLILKLTESFYRPVKGTIDFSHEVLNGLRHAVVAIGVGQHGTTSQPFIRIRNSWGTSWGDGGNAWLPFNYVDVHAVMAFKV